MLRELMPPRDTNSEPAQLVRTSVLVKAKTDRALRALAEQAHRPLSWEIRLALEAHVAEDDREPDPEGAEAAA